MSDWFDKRVGLGGTDWFGDSAPKKRTPARKLGEPRAPETVPFVPVRCPKCGGAGRTHTSPPPGPGPRLRYHRCARCEINFRSVECRQGDDGRLEPVENDP